LSDISLNITWLDIALYAPLLGWPGLLIGAVLGGFVWKRRRILGAVLGGLIGAVAWTFAMIFLR
jgi:heme O synthase-like polyprenyltransferase